MIAFISLACSMPHTISHDDVGQLRRSARHLAADDFRPRSFHFRRILAGRDEPPDVVFRARFQSKKYCDDFSRQLA